MAKLNGKTVLFSPHISIAAGNYDEGYADGKQAEHDRFWDAFQKNGTRGGYRYAFYAWPKELFAPKYDIFCDGSDSADTMFQNSNVESIDVDITINGATNGYVFLSCPELKKIQSLTVTNNVVFNRWFGGCPALEILNMHGVIGKNGFDVSSSTKLTHDSLISIVNALQNHKVLWTKTAEVFEPIENYTEYYIGDSAVGGDEGTPSICYITTGEKVQYAHSENAVGEVKGAYVCVVDGVNYVCTYAANPNTYTLTLGATNLAKLEDWEKAIATEKGWTLV